MNFIKGAGEWQAPVLFWNFIRIIKDVNEWSASCMRRHGVGQALEPVVFKC